MLMKNKSLPYYQAERRIDIFINVFLVEILNYCIQGGSVSFVAPEWPLKREADKRSTKVDYLCINNKHKTNEVLFIELKTDVNSLGKKQLEKYLQYKKWEDCLNDFEEIEKGVAPKNRTKFLNLRERLENNSLLTEDAKFLPIKIVYIILESRKEIEKKKQFNPNYYSSINVIYLDDLIDFKPVKFKAEWEMILLYLSGKGNIT